MLLQILLFLIDFTANKHTHFYIHTSTLVNIDPILTLELPICDIFTNKLRNKSKFEKRSFLWHFLPRRSKKGRGK